MMPPTAPATRIVLSGPESSGKSTLAAALADAFQVPVAAEYAREFLETGGTAPDTPAALGELARAHLAWQTHHVPPDTAVGIFDTDMLNYHIWADVAFGTVPPVIATGLAAEHHHIHLLCTPDLAWQPDPLREFPDPEKRRALFLRHLQEIEARQLRHIIISGTGPTRLDAACRAVTNILAAMPGDAGC